MILAFNVLHYIVDVPELIERIGALLRPNGVFISSTACMKEKKSLVRYIMLLLTKMRIVPKMIFYKKVELENLIKSGNFAMIKSVRISNLPEYFIVTRKKNESV